MIRVAIETATALGTVAVGDDDRVLAEVELGDQRRHAETALPGIEAALRQAGVGRGDVVVVVVGAGPGSFTGVRVAGATAKGLVAALGVPLVAYPSLLALAAAVESDGPVLALFDARRGEVYGGCWRVGDVAVDPLLQPTVGPVEEVVGAARAAVAAALGRGVPVLVGDGARRYADRLAGATIRDEPAYPRAGWLLRLAARHRAAGEVAEPAAWVPLYVRGSSAKVSNFEL